MALPGTGNSAAAGLAKSTGVVLPTSLLSEPCAMDTSGTPSVIQGLLTTLARELHARAAVEGLAFQIVGFQTGSGGFDASDPLSVIPIDPNKQSLISQQFPNPLTIPDYENIDQYAFPNQTGVSFLCRGAPAEALHAWGEIGLIAQITKSPVTPAEVGTQYLYAVVHTPLQAKTIHHTYVYRIVIQFGGV